MSEINNDEVICPGCSHQFRAIPVNVQVELAALRQRVYELEEARFDPPELEGDDA